MHQDIERRRDKLDALFRKVGSLAGDSELQAHFARYLCILVSGFLETSVRTIYGQYGHDKAIPNVARYVASQLNGFQNPKMEKIVSLTRSFSEDWADQLDMGTQGELKDAIDSIVNNRHQIAHGVDVGISFVQIQDYYRRSLKVIEMLDKHCNP